MNLSERLAALHFLSEYILSDNSTLKHKINEAALANAWFIPEFVETSLQHLANNYLHQDKLNSWIEHYVSAIEKNKAQKVGIIMAGNIPLVGFHDLLSAFVCGNISVIKLSSKDQILTQHLLNVLVEKFPEAKQLIQLETDFKTLDKLIATGSDNSARYFEYYFKNVQHIIRKNRNSVAILNGSETDEALRLLAKDIMLYFGLGCRNVSKIYVPESYNFERFLQSFQVFEHLKDHQKYRNNFDYNLSIALLNKQYYMTNNLILLLENKPLSSRISNLHYQFYTNVNDLESEIQSSLNDIQCIVSGKNDFSFKTNYFGETQFPQLTDYADNVNILEFMLN